MKLSLPIAAIIIALGFAAPAKAKDVTENIRWSVQRSELSITRLRLGVGPKIYRAACKSYSRIVNGGGTVHVNIIGAGGELITAFHVTKDKCKS
jgi:hypothetical protein